MFECDLNILAGTAPFSHSKPTNFGAAVNKIAELCQDILNQNVQTISLEVTDDVSQEREVIEGIIEPVDDYSDMKGSNISFDHGDSHNSTKYEFIMKLYLPSILE